MGIKVSIPLGSNKKRIIHFKDSYLLLPMNLRSLTKAFNVSSIKSYFPFHLTDINYVGQFPDFEYWTDVSLADYDSLRNNHGRSKEWSFREESIKYCILDCKSLFEVLVECNKLVFSQFSLNINGALTLPALAMRIFKAHYMPENTIYQILGQIEKDIREAYTGGAVDVYIPHNKANKDFDSYTRKKLYYYDVNSLYPKIMHALEMPVGKPLALLCQRVILQNLKQRFLGFFTVKSNPLTI